MSEERCTLCGETMGAGRHNSYAGGHQFAPPPKERTRFDAVYDEIRRAEQPLVPPGIVVTEPRQDNRGIEKGPGWLPPPGPPTSKPQPYVSVNGRAFLIEELAISERLDYDQDARLYGIAAMRGEATTVRFKVATILSPDVRQPNTDVTLVIPQPPDEPVFMRLQVRSTRFVQTSGFSWTEVEAVRVR